MRPACSLTRTARRPAPQWIEGTKMETVPESIAKNGHFRARPQALFVSLSTKYILCRVRFDTSGWRSWMTCAPSLTRRPSPASERVAARIVSNAMLDYQQA